jgi:hypothetical protein
MDAGAWIFIAFIIAVGAFMTDSENKKRKLIAAKQDYETALDTLKTSPANPDQRQVTLQYGREYSNLSRNSQGVAIFDEVALLNDINAACAATAVAVGNGPPKTMREKLAELKELADAKYISADEYEEMRSDVLREFAASTGV